MKNKPKSLDDAMARARGGTAPEKPSPQNLAAIHARRADEGEDVEGEDADLDPGPVDHAREDEADAEGLEDSFRRSRESSLSRRQLVDFAQFKGVALSREEQAAPMAELRKVILERLARIARH